VTCTASTCARASFLSIGEFAAASSRAVSKCLRLERGDGGTTISHEGSVQAELELHIVRDPCTAVQSIRTTKHEYGKEGSFLCMERCVCASAHTRSQAPSRLAKDSCTALYCRSRSFEFSPSRNASHADARDALCSPARLHEAPFLLCVFVCYVDVYSRRSRCRSNVLYRS
jgi:hypothetical protein